MKSLQSTIVREKGADLRKKPNGWQDFEEDML